MKFRDSVIPNRLQPGWKPTLKDIQKKYNKAQLALMLAEDEAKTANYAERLREINVNVVELEKLLNLIQPVKRSRTLRANA